MRFALVGDHPDGLNMTRALTATGRHELAAYCGSSRGAVLLRRDGLTVTAVGDLEEVLADPAIELIIVAGSPADRPAQLRRALQSERSVLCVHPADQTPDVAYEAAMIQGDTHQLLLPLLPEVLHPALARLGELARPDLGSIGAPRLVELHRYAPEGILLEPGNADQKPSLPDWMIVRAVGGEVAEVAAFAAGAEIKADEPLLLCGRYAEGGLFQATLLPGGPAPRWCLAVEGAWGRAELLFPSGWPGPARLSWHEATGEPREETWENWSPWAAMVGVLESATNRPPAGRASEKAHLQGAMSPPPLTWQDAVRCLELDDAARRSVERRRVSAVEYPEASEEVGFKGTMTLLGCALILAIPLLWLIVSSLVPRRGWWFIVPLLLLFLAVQLSCAVVHPGYAHAAQPPPGNPN